MSPDQGLWRWSLRRPWAALALAAALLLGAGAAIASLHFDLDASAAVDTPAARALREASQAFQLNERAYLLVESDAPSEARLLSLGRDLAARLEQSACVERVELGPALPDDEALAQLLERVGLLYATPVELAAHLDPAGIESTLAQQAERLSLLGLGEVEAWIERDPLELNRAFARRLARLRGVQRFAPESPYALSEDRRALLLTVVTSRGPSELGFAREVVSTVEAATQAALATPAHAGLRVRGTGGHYFAEESERTIRGDLIRGGLSCSLLALVLLAWGLRLNPWRTLVLLLPTVWGLVVGLGLFALLRAELAVLSLGCASVLLGLGVDFTIHLATATRAARARGLGPESAAAEGLRRTRGALVIAALTSIAAFLAFQLAGQRFLADMGLVTACGLLATLIGALLFVPPLLARAFPGDQALLPSRALGIEGLGTFALRRPRFVLGMACGASALALAGLWLHPPRLSGDLRQLQARGSAPLATQEAIAARFGGGLDPLLVLLEGESEQEIVAAARRLDPTLNAWVTEGRIAARASIAALLPEEAQEAAVLARLGATDPARGRERLRAGLEAVGFEPGGFTLALERWEHALARREPTTIDDLRASGLGALVERFVQPPRAGRSARGLILLTPSRQLSGERERDALARDLSAALSAHGVRGRLTGLPYLTAETTARIGADFAAISALTAFAVLAVLLLRFRRLDHALLALLPAALGTLWTAGVFALLRTDLNLMTLGVLPMVLALGVDDGVHVVHGHTARSGGGRDRAVETGIWLTSLTTGVAFGSLSVSQNQGIASVGLLSLLGIGFCLLTSIAVLPALLGRRVDQPRREHPAESSRQAPPGSGQRSDASSAT